MTFVDFLRILWRRKLLIAAVTIAVLGLTYGALREVTPQYESTATLSLDVSQLDPATTLPLLGSLDTVMPLFADLVNNSDVETRARQNNGGPLASIAVATYSGSAVLKVTARSTSPVAAQKSAQAMADALIEHGVPLKGVSLVEFAPAALPTAPVYPRKQLTYMVALLLGLGLGVGAALLRENLSTKIWTADELAAVSGVPVFAEIPEEIAVLRLKSPEALVNDSRLGVVAEALRELRTNLMFAESSVRSVVVTSPDGSHGKTTVSFGLAATFARSGSRTLLIDCDLRRGRVSEMLGMPRSPGLMEVLLGEVPLGETIHHTSLGMLDIITGGRRAGDPSEPLSNDFPGILNRLEDDYETIIIDATPIVPISDARVVSRYADATLIVCSAGTVRRRQLRAAVERLALISVRPTAVVLNHSRSVHGSKYYIQAGDLEHDEPSRSRH